MISYGCGVSCYPQFYVQHLEKYQVLPRLYLRTFEGYPGEKMIKGKWVLYLAGKSETCIWECIGRMTPKK